MTFKVATGAGEPLDSQEACERYRRRRRAGKLLKRGVNRLPFGHASKLHEGFHIFDKRIRRQARKLAIRIFHNGSAMNHLGIASD